jgi:hypothetical protein
VAHHAAKPLVQTRDGQIVIRLYQSIVLTNPTDAQLSFWVNRLHHGLKPKVLRRELFASAQRQQLLASMNIAINSTPQTFVTSLFTNVLGQTPNPALSAALVNEINGGLNRQFVVQRFFQVVQGRIALNQVATPPSTISISIAPPTGTKLTTTTSLTPTSSTTTTGATTTTPSAVGFIQQLPLSQLPLSQLPLSQLTFNQFPVSPISFTPTPLPTPPNLIVNPPTLSLVTPINAPTPPNLFL